MNLDQLILERKNRSIEAGKLQAQAIRPQGSVLVGASAGTGKTYVLTRRFLRILLEDPTCFPADILAVTFTKAAAAEMRNRITKELMTWATDSHEALTKKLTHLLERDHISDATLHRARELFPLVLDDGSSLKIMTIHSFCQSLLSQFPLEANLPPGFGVIEGRESDELIHQSIQQMYQQAPNETGPWGWAFGYLVSTMADGTLVDLFKSFLNERRRFERLFRNYEDVGLEGLLQVLAAELGLGNAPDAATPNQAFAALKTHQVQTILAERLTLKELHDVLATSGKTDQKVAAALAEFLAATTEADQLTAYEKVRSELLTKDGGIAKTPFAKKISEAHPQLHDAFIELQHACLNNAAAHASLKVYFKTAAFLTLTHSVLENYKALKAKQGAVDFEDLIYYALNLLTHSAGRGEWVRFKMDGRISHIMLDEAQDTDRDQWEIIRAFVDEFFNGQGQYDGKLDRTYFAVGDTKQSIYRFRGAQPHVFGGMGAEVGQMAAPTGHPVLPVGLNTSFRSSDVVLGLVDAVFKDAKYRRAVDGMTDPLEHKAYRLGVGGEIELWPIYEKTGASRAPRITEPLDWHIPGLDVAENTTTEPTPRERLFADLAKRIKTLVDEKPYLGASEKFLEASDVMVLFRTKTHMPAFVSALAAEGLLATVSGDIDLDQHPAVQDLMAVVRFLANPSDTLSLVHGVRSPLFGFTDADLEHWRQQTQDGRSYWASLLTQTDEPFATAGTILKDLLAEVDAATPYQTLLTLLDQTQGRARLAQRYTGSTKGAAADTLNMVVDGFLNAALDYARMQAPSLLGFISWFDRGGLTLKLEAAKTPGAVRLMTVHASKGLEAPVVILPDATQNFYSRTNKDLFFWQTDLASKTDSLMLCGVSAKPEAPLQAQLKQAEKDALFDDAMRLLYVALTRACDRLIITGIDEKGAKTANETWYNIIADQTKDLAWFEDPQTGRKTIVEAAPITGQKDITKAPETTPAPLEEWVFDPAPATPAARQFHMATDDGQQRRGADLAVNAENIYRKGLLLHRLLEVLPFIAKEERILKGQSFLKFSAADLSENKREALLEVALETIEIHQELFEGHVQGEVALFGTEAGGRVDLLKVTDNEVIIVDYKTNVHVPEIIPAGYRKQLQAYAKTAQQIWPEKRVKCAILWVNGAPPRLHWLDSE